MKILVAGLGSIGQRHVRNLRALLGDGVEILAYRARGLAQVITDTMTIEPDRQVDAHYHLRTFDCLEAAFAERPVAVLVCNPTSLHIPTALMAVRAGCHVLIEKPLSDSNEGIEELIGLVERQGLVAAVGYQLRFHPALQRLRALLCTRVVGRVVAVRAEMGEFLPDAHPYEDYRQSYAARGDLGGGVILCYSHEFDYLCWLFGMPRRVFTVGGRLGNLAIEVEDTAHTSMECRVDGRPIAVHLQQTFLQRPRSRTCEVIGEAGTIRVDLNAPTLTVTAVDGSTTERQTFDGFQRNQLFVDEMKAFLAAIAGEGAGLVPIRQAAQSLRVALAARESLGSGRVVELS